MLFRLSPQAVGVAAMAGLGPVLCVMHKLYLLMAALVLAVLSYVMAEYRLRQDQQAHAHHAHQPS